MNYNTSSPIYLQVIADIKKRLVLGELETGQQLPSTRNMALEYNVNPNTAARIYKWMELSDLCFTKRGLGTFIVDDNDLVSKLRKDMGEQVIDHFKSEMSTLG